jgi:Holliday junction resolvase-like predicted endonuclease
VLDLAICPLFDKDHARRKTANVELTDGTMKTNWHVATAAEAIAAAQFARYGYDVSVQYGANQPEYDLMITDGDEFLKVSVKGSADGGWGLTQTQLVKLRNANYHGAADAWLKRHKSRTALCLVQFKGVAGDAMPRAYLAWPAEIAERLKAASGGRGDTVLWENYTRGARAAGAGTIEMIPDSWKMTPVRIELLLRAHGTITRRTP